jgi:serine/threonine protein kinase
MADSLYMFPGFETATKSINIQPRGLQRGSSSTGSHSATLPHPDGSLNYGLIVPALAFAGLGLAYAGVRYALAKPPEDGGSSSNRDRRRRGVNAAPVDLGQPPPSPPRPRSSSAQRLAVEAAAAAARNPSGAPRGRLVQPPGAASPSPAREADRPSPLQRPGATAGGGTGSPAKWLRIKSLGSGTFGVVYLGRNTRTGQVVAIKEMRIGRAADECKKEFDLLRGLRHPFVVQIFGVESVSSNGSFGGADNSDMTASGDSDGAAAGSPGMTRLIMEYCPNGDLSDSIRKHGPCSEALLRSYARQILLGLSFLHSHNILHRDIKPANVLLDSNGRLKLTDFGMSRHMDTMRTHTALAGSPAYMSPEAVEGRYVVGTDLWAVGATLSQLATAETPWNHICDRDLRNAHALLHYIARGPAPMTASGDEIARGLAMNHHPVIPDWFSEEAQSFMKQLFEIDPVKRGTAADLLRHPFLVHGGPSPVTEASCFQFLEDDEDEESVLDDDANDGDVIISTTTGTNGTRSSGSKGSTVSKGTPSQSRTVTDTATRTRTGGPPAVNRTHPPLVPEQLSSEAPARGTDSPGGDGGGHDFQPRSVEASIPSDQAAPERNSESSPSHGAREESLRQRSVTTRSSSNASVTVHPQ